MSSPSPLQPFQIFCCKWVNAFLADISTIVILNCVLILLFTIKFLILTSKHFYFYNKDSPVHIVTNNHIVDSKHWWYTITTIHHNNCEWSQWKIFGYYVSKLLLLECGKESFGWWKRHLVYGFDIFFIELVFYLTFTLVFCQNFFNSGNLKFCMSANILFKKSKFLTLRCKIYQH